MTASDARMRMSRPRTTAALPEPAAARTVAPRQRCDLIAVKARFLHAATKLVSIALRCGNAKIQSLLLHRLVSLPDAFTLYAYSMHMLIISISRSIYL